MGFYADTSLAQLCEQIERDNPDTPPITKDNIIVLGNPTTVNTNGRNTSVSLNGKLGAGFSGRRVFYYDRVNLKYMFAGIPIVLSPPVNVKTVKDLLPTLNEVYGLNLTSVDITNPDASLGLGYTATAITLTISAQSLCFTGSLAVTWKRGVGGYYPESGPGNKYIIAGDITEGYFGTVTASEMFDGPTFYSKFNEGKTTPIGALVSGIVDKWLKFAMDGKFYFFPYGILMNAKYSDLYTEGAVYEFGATGTPPTGTPVTKQNKLISMANGDKTWWFSPTMPKLTNADPFAMYLNSASETPKSDGMIARLLNRVYTDTIYAPGDWDALNPSVISATLAFWFSNRYASQPTQSFGSAINYRNQGTYDRVSFVGGYRPILQLIAPGEATFPVANVLYELDQRRSPRLTGPAVKTEDLLHPVSEVLGYVSERRRPALSTTLNPQTAVQNVAGYVSVRRRPLLTSKVSIDTRTDLSKADGELNGFS